MPGRTYYTGLSGPGFIADHGSEKRSSGGRQVDWDQVGERFKLTPGQVIVLTAAAAADAVELAVEALEFEVAAGVRLYFGESKEFALTTDISAAGDTTIAVQALPSGLEDGDTATIEGSGLKHIPAGEVMAQLSNGKVIPRRDASVKVAVGAEGADNTGDGTITAAPTVGSAAKTGVYRIVIVEPGANVGTFVVEDPDGIQIGQGVVAAEYSDDHLTFTIADGATDFVAGDSFTVTVDVGEGTARYIAETAMDEDNKYDAKTGYGMLVGAVVYENLLPNADQDLATPVIPALYKQELREAGCTFFFEQYEDSRGS